MSAQFGTWPPAGQGVNAGVAVTPGTLAQGNVRVLATIGIASDGTIGTDPLNAVDSVDKSATGTYEIALNFTPDANTTVQAVLAGVAGEIDAAANGGGVLVHTRDSAGAAADKQFYLTVLG